MRSAARVRALACAVLGLLWLAPSDGVAAGARARRQELDRMEASLRASLTPRAATAADLGITLVREDQRLKLSFPVTITFEPDSDSLLPDAAQSLPLAATIRLLKQHRAWSAQLKIYTDGIGGASANQTASAARASALDRVLIAAGIAVARVRAGGAGTADPVGSNDTPEGRMQNRRVQIVFERAATAARSAN